MKVPFLDLKMQFRHIQAEVMTAIEKVCAEQSFILGQHVGEFEDAITEYVGCHHGVGVASGSDALLLALMVIGVKPGDEVITVPFTFFSTAGVVSRLHAKPVFVDIRADTFTMDPAQIEQKITSQTKAIIPVHLFGQCAEMERIREIADRQGVTVIEDACQAIGAARRGIRAGALGAMGCFSFFPSKNLGGFGDGGLIATNDKDLHDTLDVLRVHGSRSDYHHDLIGMNSRLDALQAAVLRVKLGHLDEWIEKRRQNAERYAQLFEQAGLLDRIVLPHTDGSNRHVFNQFTIRTQKRDQLSAYLKGKDVGNRIYYPVPLHLQECYAALGYQKGELPVSERAAAEVLSLPIYPELSEDQLAYVVDSIQAFYRTW